MSTYTTSICTRTQTHSYTESRECSDKQITNDLNYKCWAVNILNSFRFMHAAVFVCFSYWIEYVRNHSSSGLKSIVRLRFWLLNGCDAVAAAVADAMVLLHSYVRHNGQRQSLCTLVVKRKWLQRLNRKHALTSCRQLGCKKQQNPICTRWFRFEIFIRNR